MSNAITTAPGWVEHPADNRYKMVTCRGCGDHYLCTPQNDYYNATSDKDGVCIGCLLTEKGMADKPLLDYDAAARLN